MNYISLAIEYVQKGKKVTSFMLEGNSMRPFLVHKRDKALLVKPDEVHVGNPVIAEIAPGKYVLHRIVRIDGDAVTLLGDGNLTPEHCHLCDIRALATGFYRKGRTKPDLITSPKWRIYSFLWMRLRPIRRYLLFIHNILFHSVKPLS